MTYVFAAINVAVFLGVLYWIDVTKREILVLQSRLANLEERLGRGEDLTAMKRGGYS